MTITELKRSISRNSIRQDQIDSILKYYDEFIGEEESETYRICKCPGSLRIIIDDLKLYLINNDK